MRRVNERIIRNVIAGRRRNALLLDLLGVNERIIRNVIAGAFVTIVAAR